MSMEVILTIVSKLGYNLLKGLITYFRGEIIQLLSTSRTSQYVAKIPIFAKMLQVWIG